MNEVFSELKDVHPRRIFGGWGIYQDGFFFAMISNNQLFFKVNGTNKSDFEKSGSKPFVYTGQHGKSITLSYWELPAEVMENKEKLTIWFEKSILAVREAKK